MILIIDNYDSFVFNVARYFVELGQSVEVIRNDAIEVEQVRQFRPHAVVLSPGPCTPTEAGVSCEIIRDLSGIIPILGICLGHQCIGQVFGGRVVRAERPMHGRASVIRHDGQDLFSGLPNPLRSGRYHSLIVTLEDASGPLEIAARSEDGEIMALRHWRHPTYGVQFHPESILTEGGHSLLDNFLTLAAEHRRALV
jgi:para-aminobenzoate synthetase component 2